MTLQAIEITKDFPQSRERAVLLEMLKVIRLLKAEGIDAVICGGWVPFLKELARDSRLKIAREKRGLTADDVAVAVGVKQPTINRIENAKHKASPDLANRIARYFDNEVTRDQILFPEDYMVDEEPIRKPIRQRLQKAS